MDFSEDGGLLVSGGNDNAIKVWELNKNGAAPTLRLTLWGHTDAVSAVKLSPDCKTIASGSWNKTVRLWSIAQAGDPLWIFTGHKG